MANVTEPYIENELPLTESQRQYLERINKNIDFIKLQTDNYKHRIRVLFDNDMIEMLENTLDKLLFSALQLKALRNVNQLENCDKKLEKFKVSINSINSLDSEKNKNLLIEDAKNINNVIDEILTSGTNKLENISNNQNLLKTENFLKEFDSLKQKIEKFEKNKSYDIYDKEILTVFKRLTEIEESIEGIANKVNETNYVKFVQDAEQLFEKARNAEALVNKEIEELKKAKEGHIAYTLSDKLNEKVSQCKKDVRDQFILFIFSIVGVVLINCTMLGLSDKLIQDNHFWELLAMKILFNLPLVLLIFFFLNQYIKAKRLHEEFDYKVIMAQTLMNNYNRLKEDFTQDQDKLLDLLKAPIEKIFDNPVHSVYGDKSGDKGLGIDQLEKLVSIAEKLKGKKD